MSEPPPEIQEPTAVGAGSSAGEVSAARRRWLSSLIRLHTMALYILLLTTVFLSTGCRSTMCMVSTKHLHRFDGGTRSVYVTNPEMHPEYDILKASAIFQFSRQPEGARKLTLHPVQHCGRCGNPLMLTFVTFGIVPGVLPGARAFEYDLDTDGVVEHCFHPLPIYDRISIWEWLVRHDEEKVLAEALAWSALQRWPYKLLESTGTAHSFSTDK